MNLKSYLTPQYLFDINSAYISPMEKLFFLGGVVLVLLAIVLKISSVLAPTPVDGKYRRKFYVLFLTIGSAEIFWYLFRYENVRFFGSHFVAWLVVLTGLIWLAAIFISAFKNYGKEKTVWEKDQMKLKYLPK